MSTTNVNRRQFLSTSAAAAGMALASREFALGQVSANDKIRIGLIGVGGRAQSHIKALTRLPGIEIPAICDIDSTNITRSASRIERALGKRPKLYDAGPEDYKNLLADKSIDAISSALPCDLHAQVYLDAIAAGKHVYGEKPMCLTVAEGNAIVAAQEKNPHLIIQIGFQWRASERKMAMVKMIADGEIGEVFDLRGQRCSRGVIGRPNEGARIWPGRRAQSGDWMLEQACHDWDLFCWCMGQTLPTQASAFGRRDLLKDMDPDRDVTDFYKAVIEWPGTAVLSWLHNWQVPYRDSNREFSANFRRVAGTQGGIDLDNGKVFPRTANGRIRQVEGNNDDLTDAAFAAFVDAIRNKKTPISGVYNGRDAVLVGLLVRTAVDLKRTVTMKEILVQG